MRREELVRSDFPSGDDGFDREPVEAHLRAVAAHVAALEARIEALEIERDQLRGQLADARARADGSNGPPGASAEPSADPAPETAAPAASSSEDEVAARLLATRLAMEGKGRDTIVMRLATDHGLDDPGDLVDDVLARLG